MNIRLFAPLLCAFLGGAFVTGGICLIAHNAPGYGILFFFGGVGSLITAMLHKENDEIVSAVGLVEFPSNMHETHLE